MSLRDLLLLFVGAALGSAYTVVVFRGVCHRCRAHLQATDRPPKPPDAAA